MLSLQTAVYLAAEEVICGCSMISVLPKLDDTVPPVRVLITPDLKTRD